MHRSNGFTMIELLIALAIIAIGAVLGAPMVSDLMNSSRLTNTTNNVVEALAVARNEAIHRRQNVQVVPIVANDWTQGWLVQEVATNTTISTFDALPQSIRVTASEALASVVFQNNGQRVMPAAAVTLNVCIAPDLRRPGEVGRQILISMGGSTTVNSRFEGCP